jgi:CheY-like chemotaxis protein
LLSESRWKGADLKSLVGDELDPYQLGCELVSIQGPAITLEPAKAQSVALIIHELATNAAKYGALSEKTGKLHVAWTRTAEAIEISWNESGGPKIAAPNKSGFGFSVISATLRRQLRGDVHFDWRPEGLHCRISIPTRSSGGREKNDAAPRTTIDPQRRSAQNPRSVLVVEDEPLLGMMMSDALTEIGFEVLGPYGRVVEAVEAAKTQSFSVAVLDISLGGETVYEVADLLTKNGVPFLFVTGYGKENLEPRFADVRVLRKPVDLESLRIALEEATSRQAAAVA